MFSVLYRKIKQARDWFLSHKKVSRVLFVFGFFVLLFGILAPGTAQATGVVEFEGGWLVSTISQWILLPLVQLGLKLCIFVLSFIIKVASYNGYLNSPAVNIGWVLIRDITNMFFVVVLLLIAFGTILGIEQYEWKKMLVKFILAAIFVNFSRIICGVIIDAAQVVMMTFVNGVAATAGGNLIKAFSFEKILQLSQTTESSSLTDVNIFMASIASVFFVALLLAVLSIYMIILVARVVVLWVLIVLSPFAFVLSVVQQTQKYASQWWTQFGNYVISGPLIIFFIWLSFVTIGSGDITSQMGGMEFGTVDTETQQISNPSAGISDYMSWTNMANYFIGIAMLVIGIQMAQSLGVAGGSMMGKTLDFGKRVAALASGYVAGRWLYDKAVKPAAKWAAMNAPIVGGNKWIRRGKTIAAVAKRRVAEPIKRIRNNAAISLEDQKKQRLGLENKRTDLRQEKDLAKLQGAQDIDVENRGKMKMLDAQKANGTITEEEHAVKKAELEAMAEQEKKVLATKVDDDFKVREAAQAKAEADFASKYTLGPVSEAFRGILSSVVESESRANEQMEKQEKAAKSAEEITKKQSSTSATDAGVVAVIEEAKLAAEERKGKFKGEQKNEEEQRRQNQAANIAFMSGREGGDKTAQAVAASSEISAQIAKTEREREEDRLRAVHRFLKGGDLRKIANAEFGRDSFRNEIEAEQTMAKVQELDTVGGSAARMATTQASRQTWEILRQRNLGSKVSEVEESDYIKARQLQEDEEAAQEDGVDDNTRTREFAAADVAKRKAEIDSYKKQEEQLSENLRDLASLEELDRIAYNDSTATVEQAREADEKAKEIRKRNGLTDSEYAKGEDLEKMKSDLEAVNNNIADSENELRKSESDAKNVGKIAAKDSGEAEKQLQALEAIRNAIKKRDGDDENGTAAEARVTAVLSQNGVATQVGAFGVARDAKAVMTAMESKSILGKIFDVLKMEKARGQRTKNVENLMKASPEIASAYYTAKTDEQSIFKTQAEGSLKRAVAQRQIYDRRGMKNLPEETDVSTFESIAKKMGTVEKEQLLSIWNERAALVGEKRKQHQEWEDSGHTRGEEYKAVDQKKDQAYTNGAILAVLQQTGYNDDASAELGKYLKVESGGAEFDVGGKKISPEKYVDGLWQAVKKCGRAPAAQIDQHIQIVQNSTTAQAAVRGILGSMQSHPQSGAGDLSEMLNQFQQLGHKEKLERMILELSGKQDPAFMSHLRNLGTTTEELFPLLKKLSENLHTRNTHLGIK